MYKAFDLFRIHSRLRVRTFQAFVHSRRKDLLLKIGCEIFFNDLSINRPNRFCNLTLHNTHLEPNHPAFEEIDGDKA